MIQRSDSSSRVASRNRGLTRRSSFLRSSHPNGCQVPRASTPSPRGSLAAGGCGATAIPRKPRSGGHGSPELSTDQPRPPIPGLVEARIYFRLGSCGPVPTAHARPRSTRAGQPRAHGTRGETDLFRNLTGATPLTILEHIQDRSVFRSTLCGRTCSVRSGRRNRTPISSQTGAGNPLSRHSAIILCAPLPHWSERLGS